MGIDACLQDTQSILSCNATCSFLEHGVVYLQTVFITTTQQYYVPHRPGHTTHNIKLSYHHPAATTPTTTSKAWIHVAIIFTENVHITQCNINRLAHRNVWIQDSHPFNGLFFQDNLVSWHQKSKPI